MASAADSKPAGRRERPRQKKRTPSPQGAGNVRDKKRRTPSPAGRRERPRQKSGLQARRAQGTSASKKSRAGHSGESRARRERRPGRSRAPRAHWREANAHPSLGKAQNGQKSGNFFGRRYYKAKYEDRTFANRSIRMVRYKCSFLAMGGPNRVKSQTLMAFGYQK